MRKRYKYRSHLLLICGSIFLLCISSYKALAQEASSLTIWNNIISIENNDQLSVAEKLFGCEKLKQLFDNSHLPADSVYARLLHRIGALQFQLNQAIATQEAIDNTIKAIQINNSGNRNCSPYFAINSYVNLATYYETIKFYKKAYTYYDSAIIHNDNKKLSNPLADLCYINKVLINLRLGDYQSCIEDCTKGIFIAQGSARLSMLAALYNQRAQSYLYLHKTSLAFSDIDSARKYAQIINSDYELATEVKTRALLQAELKQYSNAVKSFSAALKYRIADGDLAQIADDYTDIGNFHLKRKEYNKAIDSYNKTIQYANKANDAERMCKGYTNLGEVFFLKGSAIDYEQSERYYAKALEIFGIHEKSVLENPSLQKLGTIANTDLLLVILGNKAELLLHLYKTDTKKEYLDACISTGLLMDSAVTMARHEQTGESSKLYWRNRTRNFFVNIIEACYLANDIPHAFYFMEKSRAVLLNDKLNETAASILLPEHESKKEQEFKFRLVEAKMQMNSVGVGGSDYNRRQLNFLQVKDEFERYIKTLEQRYPAYYKYKYDDDIPALHALQERLAKNNETFIHYFLEDTILYALAITASGAKLMKAAQQQFSAADLKVFMDMCSDKQRLNNNFNAFAALSYKLYNVLFAELQVAPGRVIVSQDNTLIPFEVLSKEENGKFFLLYDYTFSYVYSASFLLKQTTNRNANADFIGFAPVSYSTGLRLPDLKNAAIALQQSASYYNSVVLLEQNAATRKSFLNQIAGYNIVSVFSHAFADTLNNEPVMFMYDSMINLSELQLLNNPATQLVILSACQTNVGRNETGEGIYSLARGFASAGIPAVSATLWKADEYAIYQISEIFNECISKGLRKDEALRQAKLKFIEGSSNEKLLPYYWANMILIGKSDPVKLLPQSSIYKILWWIIGTTGVIALLFIIKYYLNKKTINRHEKSRH
ncbi:hypothetical protein DC498_05415 [Terrimonas sp.]|uniref:CHAT domain-containing protein n=1 Tax=Terrimonas sp. TaxID=1914338 RepID=UPI000D50F940|nr:CHAT domain-containing tetratricopeptide repeat protein [Terrimonas sp.]PVD53315.1 hypothetical protein DC498_05415 [Terrimonas sp.]